MSIKDVRFGINFYRHVPNIDTCMNIVKDWKISFACLNISSLKMETDNVSSGIMNSEFAKDWCHCTIAKIYEHLDVDSLDENTRLENQKFLNQDISWAIFLNVHSIMFELPLEGDFANLIRLLDNQIDTYLNSANLIQFWMVVPIIDLKIDPWLKWTKFISSVRNISRMRLVLDIRIKLPSEVVLNRWLGEPVAAILIPSDIFKMNKKHRIVLPKLHRKFIRKMFNIGCQIIISGNTSTMHFHYLSDLYNSTTSLTPYSNEYINGFEDYLQTPLQPLKNNLQSYVYETFEQDSIKYYEYERAIFKALNDISKHLESVIVYVVGAGRGPLVDVTLKAAKDLDIIVKVFAIEKNENALPTLYLKNKEKWQNCVTIINSDMRFWNPKQKCDILVSELLGSFGDNELSPECLDGAQNYLKKDGITIPSSYTSFLSPVQSRKLYAEILSIKKNKDNCNFQKPYVVQLNNVYNIAPAKPLFTFTHPNSNVKDNSNDREGVLTFNVSQDCVLHGFAGYFETVLYKNIHLSIVPETFTENMVSWFPVFFPIMNPMILNKDEELQINFWRCSDKSRVWYEWCITKPYQGVMHNTNGEMYCMPL